MSAPFTAPKRRSSAIFGRLIVGIVLGIAAFAAAIGQYYARIAGPTDAPTEVPFLGGTILVSGDLPAPSFVNDTRQRRSGDDPDP